MENLGKEIQLRKLIGLQVGKHLFLKKLTQEKAALKSGVTDSQMSSVVNGNTNYTIDTLARIILALNFKIKLNPSVFAEIINS